MKHVFAVQTAEELGRYQTYAAEIQERLSMYLNFLRETYQVTELPRSIVWTNLETATYLINDLPVPGYTNEYRTVFCPELEVWRSIYLRQLDALDNAEIRKYYETRLTGNHVLQILGHEFVHHSELFADSFEGDYSSGIWFEEGMCEYISRKYFLTAEEFDESAHVNQQLTDLFRAKYGNHTLENFGAATYAGDYASIFFEYWRSFLAVNEIVDRFDGDVMAVFREYRLWIENDRKGTLLDWFHLKL